MWNYRPLLIAMAGFAVFAVVATLFVVMAVRVLV